jgi:hypothetical protein
MKYSMLLPAASGLFAPSVLEALALLATVVIAGVRS